ncbi:MAG: DUF930 domain-containing protein [Devosia sp.]
MSETSLFDPLPIERRAPWGTLASFALHGGLALAVILLSPLRQLVVPPPEPVAVDLVTPAQFAALTPVEAPPLLSVPVGPAEAPVAPDRPADTPAPDRSEAPAPVTARTMYSADLLKSPAMAGVRRTLTTLADTERVIQLCNIEGLEQIRHAAPSYAPDTLVPYAMGDLEGSGLALIASGGAFRSRRRWYAVSFTCTAAADYSGVTAFVFTLGAAIPEAEWDAHSLTVEDAAE